MRHSSWKTILGAALLAAVLALGVGRLFVLRFKAGDIYPPYSSLRADPLGAKALYDALGEVHGVTVARNYEPFDKLTDRATSVILFAGLTPNDYWDQETLDALESAAKSGARLVLTFLPAENAPAKTPKSQKTDKKQKKSDDTDRLYDAGEFGKRWGFGIGYQQLHPGAYRAISTRPDLEPSTSWHTDFYFRKPDPHWRVLYQCEKRPVIIERDFGKGSILLAADSYLLSNEAMQSEREPRLLAWMLGSRPSVIFDERHLGVEENPGIADLMRKYRLGGLIAALAVLAGLFVWQTASPLVPPARDADSSGVVLGRDSASGFISLLRRGIPPASLIAACLEQWKKSFAHNPAKVAGTLDRIEAAATSPDPAQAYRTISQILSEKKHAHQSRRN